MDFDSDCASHGIAGLSPLDTWRLADSFSVIEAALLLAGHDPAENTWVEHEENKPKGYSATRSVIIAAILDAQLRASGQLEPGSVSHATDWGKVRVKAADIRTWLATKGISSGFFFFKVDAVKPPDYLDRGHPRYSNKLAAAVEAWIALEDEKLLAGKSVKQAASKWLNENAAKYELTDKNSGAPIRLAVDEIAKVVNWKPDGGAPSTPSRKQPAQGRNKVRIERT